MAKKGSGDHVNMAFTGEKIITKTMESCLHDSMMPYSEHVILERALPRIEDGLKPVQRRILYTMYELSLTPDKPHKKSARIVGDCMGKYHPHGDSSVYDAMVRLAQDFVMRKPLVDGHGNFGTMDGDSAAASRYTEARMKPLALEMLRDIDKDTVEFQLNFDDTLKEPCLLPGRFPNLLVNGANGIAVGFATYIPTHNLGEAIDACIALMDNPDITLDELMEIMPAPDFPTGGYIIDNEVIRKAYETGRGKIINRAKTVIEPQRNGKNLIVITEMPYQVNKAQMLTKIQQLCQEKKNTLKAFSQITDIRDESDRMGLRAVIEVKKDADPEAVLNALFKHSDMQQTIGVNMVVVADGKPKCLGLIPLLKAYIAHQEKVVTRRTKYELEAAKKREHILDGLLIALLNIDEVIKLIRASKTPKEAKDGLMARFGLSDLQAQAILDLRLQRLTNLEQIEIENEAKEIKARIAELEKILASHAKLIKVIRREMQEIRNNYADPRRTEIIKLDASYKDYADQAVEKIVYDMTVEVYVDKNATDGTEEVRIAKRARNVQNPDDSGDCPKYTFATKTDKYIKLFTNKGGLITLSVEDLPEQQRTKARQKPVPLASLVPLEDNERVVAAYEADHADKDDKRELYFYTTHGMVKRSLYSNFFTKKARVEAITLKDGDELLSMEILSPEKIQSGTLLLISERGMCIRFTAESIPAIGRAGGGVKSMKLEIGDRVTFGKCIDDVGEVIVISDRGYAKRTFVFDYDVQGRNGKGVKTFDFKKNGANGRRIVSAIYTQEAIDIEIEMLHGSKNIVNSLDIASDRRASGGRVAVVSVLDDLVTGAKVIVKAPETLV